MSKPSKLFFQGKKQAQKGLNIFRFHNEFPAGLLGGRRGLSSKSLLNGSFFAAFPKTTLVKPGSGLWKVKQGVDDCKLHQAEQGFCQVELETDFTFLIFTNLALYIVFGPELKT